MRNTFSLNSLTECCEQNFVAKLNVFKYFPHKGKTITFEIMQVKGFIL